MTLLTTEIHNPNDPDHALIVFAADSRISRGSSKADIRKKIFRVPGLSAGIGYFGLAEVPGAAGAIPMGEWLEAFLANLSGGESLEQLATKLTESLNASIPTKLRTTQISGFHIAGFNSKGLPEFWFVRNVDDDRQTILGEYAAREDFQRRDAPTLPPDSFQVYRNGDLRAHVLVWEEIDKSLGILLNAQDFKKLTTPDDYVAWVRFKMELIAKFYEQFCTRSIIGSPVDAFPVTRI